MIGGTAMTQPIFMDRLVTQQQQRRFAYLHYCYFFVLLLLLPFRSNLKFILLPSKSKYQRH